MQINAQTAQKERKGKVKLPSEVNEQGIARI